MGIGDASRPAATNSRWLSLSSSFFVFSSPLHGAFGSIEEMARPPHFKNLTKASQIFQTALFRDQKEVPEEYLKEAGERLGEQACRLMDDPDFGRAWGKIMRRIMRRGPDWESQSEKIFALPGLIVLAVTQRKINQTDWEWIWASETGKSWKALQEFPTQVLSFANDIERVNHGPYFKNEGASLLIKELNAYVRFLEKRLREIHERTRHTFPSNRGHSPELFDVSNSVMELTGKFCDAEVVTFLNVGATILGIKSWKQIDELDLRQARARRMKPAKK